MNHSSIRDNPLPCFPLSLPFPHCFSVPGERFELPSYLLQSSLRTSATLTAPGQSYLVSRLAKLADANVLLGTLSNGASGSARLRRPPLLLLRRLPLPSTRTVVKCHSDGDLPTGLKSAFAKECRTTSAGTRNTLLRSTTLPANAFDATSDPLPAPAEENSHMYCESPNDMSPPTLTHSPSSTESSSSDRTIHMASFIDNVETAFLDPKFSQFGHKPE
jgi:hypothetical protein